MVSLYYKPSRFAKINITKDGINLEMWYIKTIIIEIV